MKHLIPSRHPVRSTSHRTAVAAVFCCVLLSACATPTRPVPYAALASAPLMTANPGDQSRRMPFEYTAPDCDWSRYTAAMLDPVAIYSGRDAQFGMATDDDKRAVAAYMQATFEATLRRQYALATAPRADALRVHVTLTGFETNTPVVSTLSKILPVGLIVNSVKSASGQQARDSGSVSYAVEIHDATSGQLLRAYVTKEYPMAEDVLASVGPLDATRAGVREGAEALLTQLR